jgi:hypothetical protein
VDLVSLCEQELGQIRAVLAGDARDERGLHRSRIKELDTLTA